jgi:peptidyl-dipeptidase Dcp
MNNSSNPFLNTWDTPFGIPPFNLIKNDHYLPAFEQAKQAHDDEINTIIQSVEEPTFLNTIEALENSGALLRKVVNVFFNLKSSDTSAELQEIESVISPAYVAHWGQIRTHPELFARIKTVFESRDAQGLSNEQLQLIEEVHQQFIRAGAALSESERVTVNSLNEELSRLATRFSQNNLNPTNEFELVMDQPEELAGLPDSVLAAAASEAETRGCPGKYVFTISRSSITPFLQFSDRRDLREQMYTAYTQCGDNNDSHDNKEIILKTAKLRSQRAKLLGFESHAEFMLDDRMARTPAGVQDLLVKLWEPAAAKVRQEAEDLQAAIQDEGGNFQLEPWDWWYYTEKVCAARYDLDEEAVKPYFKLENVRDGAFQVATQLYGITFTPCPDVPVYHKDVSAYEVNDADGSHIGLFLVDYFMRPSKRGGAWMNNFREQSQLGENVRPIVVNVCNFARGAKGSPSLLGFDEVRTLFHEFGHALHGLLSQVKYRSLAGTNVKQDFVELPSQIMEHWALESQVMKNYARHYQTGEPIPDELIDKIHASHTFNQGFATTEYLAASFLDMAWHTTDPDEITDVNEFEQQTLDSLQLIPQVAPRYRSTYFQHIFTGDSYSAGYYSYIWAEVLDADGYEAFRENGIFDQDTASLFRQHILERGGTADPMELYKLFRGREPRVEPLLKERGLT